MRGDSPVHYAIRHPWGLTYRPRLCTARRAAKAAAPRKDGAQAIILCALAFLVYIVMPDMEEPWLQYACGDVYLNYKGRTAAFLSPRAGRTLTTF